MSKQPKETDPITELRKVIRGVQSFSNEMKRKKIHVGIGNPPICCTCHKPWNECKGR